MIVRIKDVNPRTTILAAVTAVVAITAWFSQTYLFPAYDEYSSRRELASMKAMELVRLQRNVASRELIEEAYKTVGDSLEKTGTDSAILSEFLRTLESKARLPSMQIINIKPFPVKVEGDVNTYGVRLAVAGKLQEVLRFTSALSEDDLGVGIDSFSLRGIQGGRKVECSADVRMVRFSRRKTSGNISQLLSGGEAN